LAGFYAAYQTLGEHTALFCRYLYQGSCNSCASSRLYAHLHSGANHRSISSCGTPQRQSSWRLARPSRPPRRSDKQVSC